MLEAAVPAPDAFGLPEFDRMLGGAFPGLRVDQEPGLRFVVSDPERQAAKGIVDTSYYTFHVRTSAAPSFTAYRGGPFDVTRRYNDFVFLRDVLVEEFPGTAISPLPEKSTVGSVDKLIDGIADVRGLLMYRERGLKKFLQCIGSHPALRDSPHLHAFVTQPREDFRLYRDRINAERTARKAAETGGGTGAALAKATAALSFLKRTVSGPPPPCGDEGGMWGHRREYLQQFQSAIGAMREGLQVLREQHKQHYTLFRDVARAFRDLEVAERGTDPAVAAECSSQAKMWTAHAGLQADLLEAESEKVMDGLFYWYNTASELLSALNLFFEERAATAQLQPGPKRDAAVTREQKADANLQAEMTRFTTWKQDDLREIVRAFVSIMVHYSARLGLIFEAASA